jgi:hypothetical protein
LQRLSDRERAFLSVLGWCLLVRGVLTLVLIGGLMRWAGFTFNHHNWAFAEFWISTAVTATGLGAVLLLMLARRC